MAPYSYYYCFSLVLMLVVAYYIVNAVLIRTRGKTTFGLNFKPNTPEYKKLMVFANNRNIAISAAVALVLVINLFYSAILLLRLDTPTANFMLWFGPVFMGLIVATGLFIEGKKSS